MRWICTLESRTPQTDHSRGEVFAVGDEKAVVRLPEGGTAICHASGWTSYLMELPEWREIRYCRLVALHPKRSYESAADVYGDPAVMACLHGTRCSRSLYCLAYLNQQEFLDPGDFPTCQDLAAGGAIPSMTPASLAEGRW